MRIFKDRTPLLSNAGDDSSGNECEVCARQRLLFWYLCCLVFIAIIAFGVGLARGQPTIDDSPVTDGGGIVDPSTPITYRPHCLLWLEHDLFIASACEDAEYQEWLVWLAYWSYYQCINDPGGIIETDDDGPFILGDPYEPWPVSDPLYEDPGFPIVWPTNPEQRPCFLCIREWRAGSQSCREQWGPHWNDHWAECERIAAMRLLRCMTVCWDSTQDPLPANP